VSEKKLAADPEALRLLREATFAIHEEARSQIARRLCVARLPLTRGDLRKSSTCPTTMGCSSPTGTCFRYVEKIDHGLRGAPGDGAGGVDAVEPRPAQGSW